jgi:hypothetical protein
MMSSPRSSNITVLCPHKRARCARHNPNTQSTSRDHRLIPPDHSHTTPHLDVHTTRLQRIQHSVIDTRILHGNLSIITNTKIAIHPVPTAQMSGHSFHLFRTPLHTRYHGVQCHTDVYDTTIMLRLNNIFHGIVPKVRNGQSTIVIYPPSLAPSPPRPVAICSPWDNRVGRASIGTRDN